MIFYAASPDELRSDCGRFWLFWYDGRWSAWRRGRPPLDPGGKLSTFESPEAAARACHEVSVLSQEAA